MNQNNKSDSEFQGYLDIANIYTKNDTFLGFKTRYIVISGRFVKFGQKNERFRFLNFLKDKFRFLSMKFSCFLRDLLCD